MCICNNNNFKRGQLIWELWEGHVRIWKGEEGVEIMQTLEYEILKKD